LYILYVSRLSFHFPFAPTALGFDAAISRVEVHVHKLILLLLLLLMLTQCGRNFYCDKIFSNHTDFLEIQYPGIADLRSTEKGDLNDSFWSYVCLKTEGV
jgi:hypothetical protein